MTSTTAPRRHRVTSLVSGVSAVAVVLGLALVGWAFARQEQPPSAPAAVGAVDPSPSGDPGPGAPTARTADGGPPPGKARGSEGGPQRTPPADKGARARDRAPAPLPLSPPRRLQIPAVEIDTAVNPIGKNPDGTLAVPQPGPRLDEAAWFDLSPSPGQPGPAIIEGHVDTEQGPSVFYELAAVRPGDEIVVTRKDGVVTTFTVDGLRDVQKSSFPTDLVYGAGDLSTPTLRLITCSQFDSDLGTHVGNTVVFATLTQVERR